MSKNKTRTKDKYRVVYNDTQRIELENEFRLNEYIAIPRKQEIASKLQLSERQIKIWFQNRRAKKRKQQKRKQSGVVSTTSVTNGCSTTANSSPISTSSSVAPHQIISGATTTITPIASQHHHLGNLANSNNQHIISSTAHSAQVTSSSFIAQQQHESQHYQQKTLTNNLEHLNTVAQRHYQPQDHYQSLAHRQHAYQMMGHPNHSQHHHNGNSLSLLAASAQSHLGNKQMRPLASHSTSLVSSPETLSNNSNTTNEPVTGTNGDASAARLPSTSPSNADANTKRESISSADSSSSSSTYQQQQQEQVQRIQTSNNNNNYNNHHHHQPPHSLYANTSFYGQTVTATHQRHNSQPHYSFDRAHQEYYATVFNQQQQQLGNDQMVANSEANMTSASWLPQASHHDPSSVSPVVQLPADQHLNHNHHQHLQHRQQFHNHSHLNQQVQNPPQAGLAEQHTALAGAALQAPSDSSSAALAAAISTSPYLATNASYATNGYASHNHQPLAQQISNGSNNNNYPQPSIQHQNHIHPHHHNQHHLHSHHHQHHRQLIDYATMAASVNNNSHQTPAATTTQSLSPNVTRATCSPMQTNTTTTAINEQTQLITDDSYHYNATAAADAAMLTNVIHGGNLKGKHAIHY